VTVISGYLDSSITTKRGARRKEEQCVEGIRAGFTPIVVPVSRTSIMRRLTTVSVFVLGFCLSPALMAHHPDWKGMPVRPRIDVIGPLGTHLKPSYRRRFNRPSSVVGRLMYHIAPSSQEAMAWHSANHRMLYKNHRPRMEQHYFYPKPWEGLRQSANQPEVEILPLDDYGSSAINGPVELVTEDPQGAPIR
jgi:hypothetical protein